MAGTRGARRSHALSVDQMDARMDALCVDQMVQHFERHLPLSHFSSPSPSPWSGRTSIGTLHEDFRYVDPS